MRDIFRGLNYLAYFDLDLCKKNEIVGYPQMNLYKDGKFVEQFKGDRDYEIITEFIAKYAAQASTHPDASQTSHGSPNPDGKVLELGASNFQKTIDKGPVFVKFFAPWYAHLHWVASACSLCTGAVTARSLPPTGPTSRCI